MEDLKEKAAGLSPVQQPPEPILPALRQDLCLMPGSPTRDGVEMWVLHDPACNRYFRMGPMALHLLKRWKAGLTVSAFLDDPNIDESAARQEVIDLIRFLSRNHLIKTTTPEDTTRLAMLKKRGRSRGLSWFLRNYLYFRIPLVNPDRFLDRTLPWVTPLFSRWMGCMVVALGLLGLLLVFRQWEVFLATLIHFSSGQGMVLFAVTLVGVKALHELGHAYTAKRMGCRVPCMGVAFLVLYPMLYTDTTDSWRLPDHRQRLKISLAGIKVELALAMIATFAWSFLDTGLLRSAAFFVATVSWVMSLSINLSPFMRFDGYYALVDWLEEENLQSRAFALARWHLRECLFGFGEVPPERLSDRRKRIFLTYAWSTWVYRFFLFLGIALLVYHLAFKALGVVLFVVEIWAFILRPVWGEVALWWRRRHHPRKTRRLLLVGGLLCLLVLGIFLPWRRVIAIPAVLKAQACTPIYPREDGRLEDIFVAAGESVTKGQPLFRMTSPALEHRLETLKIQITVTRTLMGRYVASTRDLESLSVLQRRLGALETEAEGLKERLNRLTARAPFGGTINEMEHLHIGQWLSKKAALAELVMESGAQVEAYVQEGCLTQVMPAAKGRFLASVGTLGWTGVQVEGVDQAAVTTLKDPMLADIYGGPIPVREGPKGLIRPEKGIYRVVLQTEETLPTPDWPLAGTVHLDGPPTSIARRFWQRAVSVLIRESGF